MVDVRWLEDAASSILPSFLRTQTFFGNQSSLIPAKNLAHRVLTSSRDNKDDNDDNDDDDNSNIIPII